jgi:hypothetical protein
VTLSTTRNVAMAAGQSRFIPYPHYDQRPETDQTEDQRPETRDIA